MRAGLALILVGHVNLLLGAVLHGTVLRHVANPRGAVTPEYTTANVISVGSGLLSVSVGLVALLASRNLLRPRLHWALLVLAVANLLLSTACSLGLLLAVSLTVANGGRRLIADCHPGLLDPSIPLDQGPGHSDCPFDPTRIYVSVLSLFADHKALICPFNHSNLPCLPCFLLVPPDLSSSPFRIQPWLFGSLLCSCLQQRLFYLVTAVWQHSPSVGLGPAGRKGYRGR
ncbi:keratinocyte-associated protein 3 isoform X3 [Pteropus alecto]|uniref:keratinocyte-associated protein 3 isoform X3 n=1 Tax=Pteropus alecto TaxID=9402 RepID=UPI000D537AE8|nr:keratinocyte-associated protein 3 isoform X3 [Pteropus alecto]